MYPVGRLLETQTAASMWIGSLLRQQLLHGLLGALEILGQEICLLPRGLRFFLVATLFQRPRQQ